MPKRPRDPPFKGTVLIDHTQWLARRHAAMDDLPICQRVLLMERQEMIADVAARQRRYLSAMDQIHNDSLQQLGASPKKHANKIPSSQSASSELTSYQRVALLLKDID